MKKYMILLFLIFFVFCGTGEKSVDDSHSEDEHAHELTEAPVKDEHEHQELKISPEQQKEWGIKIGEASEIIVSPRVSLPGVITLDQNNTASISSFAEGKIISLSTDLGDYVSKGQVLLTINSPDFARAQVDFLQARAYFLLSHKEYERAKMLLKEKAIEEKEFLRREAEYEKASTEAGVKGSMLHSFGLDHAQIEKIIERCESLDPEGYLCEVTDPNLEIFSPIEGKIIYRDAIIGEHIEPKKILFRVSNLNSLWALLDAFEKDLPFINKNNKVSISTSLYPKKKFMGKITYISDMIDEKLRTAKVRVEVENKENLLKPNMYIQGNIENTEAKRKLLAIPEEAVQNFNGEKIVFVLEEENIFAAREVEISEKIDKQRIITAGLKLGERIVIKGAFNLKSELVKGSVGSTHVH